MENAKTLLKDITNLRSNWDEYSNFRLKGVSNLSLSDIDTIELYANSYIETNGRSFSGYIEPDGAIKEVLDKYDIKVKSFNIFG